MKRLATATLLLAGTSIALTGASQDAARDAAPYTTPAGVTFSPAELRRVLQASPLPGPPADPTNRFADDPAAAHFGQYLFFDTRFSGDGRFSCATCHVPADHFTDGNQLAEGMRTGTRHTPGLWNVAYNRWFFLDGRADTLWSQAIQPLENEAELGGDRMHVTHVLAGDPALRDAYEAIFGPLPDVSDLARFPKHARPVANQPEHPHQQAWSAMRVDDREAVTRVIVNVAKALAAYQRRIVSRSAPFDRFVEGLRTNDETKLRALSESAQRGLKLFVGEANCRLCHSGPNFSDGEFHNIGVPPLGGGVPRDSGRLDGLQKLFADPFRSDGAYSDDPKGRTAERLTFMRPTPEDWGRFKTPSLRNVAVTGPYMHQGQFATLRDVLMYYATLEGSTALHHQEPFLASLELDQIEDVQAFLESLTDVGLEPGLLVKPISPKPGTE